MPSPAEPRILLATRSHDKAREIAHILPPFLHGRIISLDEAGIAPADDEAGIEAFDTFLANAHAKAAFFMDRSGLPTLADDSGIGVAALDGAPGVRSRRFALTHGLHGAELDRANNQRLLDELHGLPLPRRAAHYTCAAVLHRPRGDSTAAIGTCAGFILEQPRGSAGFGYDPLFLDPATGLSFAELVPADKNRRSHRARAFRALLAGVRIDA